MNARRLRVRAFDGSGELNVPLYELLSDTEVLGRMAMEWAAGGLVDPAVRIALEPVGQEVAATATSTSAVSRARSWL